MGNTKLNVVTIIGTRPEAVKMAPVVREFQAQSEHFNHTLINTSQHRELVSQALSDFGLSADVNLSLMQEDQKLGDFVSRALTVLSKTLHAPLDYVLVQGDTSTVLAGALASFYLGIKVAHVEAGLRSGNIRDPFPEELNRQLVSRIATVHFAPTPRARRNLLAEGVPSKDVIVTGNTAVDALKSAAIGSEFNMPQLASVGWKQRKILLVTVHRRENHGARLRSICAALRRIAEEHSEVEIVLPVHLNPNVRQIVFEMLGNVDRVNLTAPIGYLDLLLCLKECYGVLTDSGGLQEEAPSFKKPVLVLRETTERPELVESGSGKLVGTNTDVIVSATRDLILEPNTYTQMSCAGNPFGDGNAAKRIVNTLRSIHSGFAEIAGPV